MQNSGIWFVRQLSFTLLFFVISFPVCAQEGAYTPPPMFGAPPPLPPANADVPPPAPAPVISKPVIEAPKVSAKAPLPVAKPAPLKEPAKEIVKEAPAEKMAAVVAPLPKRKPSVPDQKIAEVQQAKPVPAAEPVQEEKSYPGVVTGPKTMPAVPASGYEAEVVYNAETNQAEGAILRRHIAAKEEEKPVAPKSIPLPDGPRLDIYEMEDGKAKKLVIPYDVGQKMPQDSMMRAFVITGLDILQQNPDWRVQILAYATPFDAGQSSDRRMALTRALDLRESLLENGVEPRRIDVRALGGRDETGEGPSDRADIVFFAP